MGANKSPLPTVCRSSSLCLQDCTFSEAPVTQIRRTEIFFTIICLLPFLKKRISQNWKPSTYLTNKYLNSLIFGFLDLTKQVFLTDPLNMWPVLPGGEPEDFGDEAGRQATDTGLWWRSTQCPVRPPQLGFLLLLPQLPAVERLQQLHVFNSKSVLFYCFRLSCSQLVFFFFS